MTPIYGMRNLIKMIADSNKEIITSFFNVSAC